MASLTWAVLLFAGLSCINALGTQTSIEEHPSMVQIDYRIYTGWSQQCVGNVVSNYHIVTAASCFQDVYTNRRVRAGAGVRHTGGTIAEISNSFNHPSYGSNGDDGDITVVRLQTSLILGQTIAQVAIVPQNYFVTQDQHVNLVGWGSTAEGGVLGNDYLYNLQLKTRSINDCLRQYASYDPPRTVTANMLCVGLESYGGRNLDTRDSGAPIFYFNALAGIVSFGSSRASDDVPIVATAVGAYTNWIIETAV